MADSVVPVSLQIRDSAREPVKSELRIEPIPSGARVGKAVGIGLALLACAVGSVFIPLLHFVLVPGFVIAAIAVPIGIARASVRVTSTELKCPKCEQVTPIEPGRTGWPVALWCKQCGTSFKATPA